MNKIILVDGNNLLFRSYFATAYNGNLMKNSKGIPTNALYGFINMMNKIIKEEKPQYIMVAFDKGKTFRHEKYDFYKDGRDETPTELKVQFPIAKELLLSMGIKYLEIENYEADDIIGTFAKKVKEDSGMDATIISSDKDLLQLIEDDIDVKLLKMHDYVRMDKKTFIDTYKVDPINMIDLKALMGDPSDNIPGVKGIGEKTAISLLEKYKTIENLYNNIEEVKGKVKEKLLNDKENCFMSKEIATICVDVPIEIDFEDYKYDGVTVLKYIEMLEDLEFFSIIKKLDIPEDIVNSKKENIEYTILKELTNFDMKDNYSIYVEMLGENYHKSIILGVGVYNDKYKYYIPIDVILKNKNIFMDNYEKYTYDLKKLLVLFKYNDININNCKSDIMIASYLLNYNVKNDIAILANSMGYNIDFYEDVYGKNNKFKLLSDDDIAYQCINKAKFIYDSYCDIHNKIEEEDSYLYNNIEIPLAEVLADMEFSGIKVDKNLLEEQKKKLEEKIVLLEKEIINDTNIEFNISSPKQLGDVLFNKLGIEYPKKVKNNNYSTSKEILDKLKDKYPIVNKILDYRSYTKIYSNYIIGILNEIQSDGKIHSIFNQTLTRTGRLSCEEPNLQNIPIRYDLGREIRKVFVANDDSILLSSDYSQIELRIFAALSNTKNLIEAFKNNQDIHKKTASDIFNVDIDCVTKEQRRCAKAVNFGILYGISGFGLSEDLNIDYSEAKGFIESYLNTYPGIKSFMNDLIEKAKKDGYVKTIMNRKRIINELYDKNYLIRSQGERMALNTPIQGSSADILKKAMVDIYQEFKKNNLKSKMIIQVHDELIFNVLNNEIEIVEKIVREKMENVYELSVPLKVEIEKGSNWYEAK